MNNEETLIDAFRKLQELLSFINSHLNTDYEALQHIRYQAQHERKKHGEIVLANQSQQKLNEQLKAESEKILKERDEKIKVKDEESYKRLSEVNTEIIVKRSELEKLNAEIYRISNNILHNKQENKVKVK